MYITCARLAAACLPICVDSRLLARPVAPSCSHYLAIGLSLNLICCQWPRQEMR